MSSPPKRDGGITIANRDEAAPLISLNNTSSQASDADTRLGPPSPTEGSPRGPPHSTESLQNRLFTKLFTQLVPSEHVDQRGVKDDGGKTTKKGDRRGREHVERPGFNLLVMNANFRRFNARIGPVFVLQNRFIRLFSWKDPSATLSFLVSAATR